MDAIYEETLWMYSASQGPDDDLFSLLNSRDYHPWHSSRNIKIFGDSQHTIEINGHLLENHLILCVPTNETPDNIDAALEEFRLALLQKFRENIGGHYAISESEFDESIFMNQLVHNPCLIKDWDQIQKFMIGLWTWDRHWFNKETISNACENILDQIETIKEEIGATGIYPYSNITVKRFYEDSAKEIRAHSPKEPLSSAKIDQFVTRTQSVILGP
jgi:hypothetical protein